MSDETCITSWKYLIKTFIIEKLSVPTCVVVHMCWRAFHANWWWRNEKGFVKQDRVIQRILIMNFSSIVKATCDCVFRNLVEKLRKLIKVMIYFREWEIKNVVCSHIQMLMRIFAKVVKTSLVNAKSSTNLWVFKN